ncbi:MAG: hypothetical protein ACUVV5_08480 [Candidatus Aminicenantales bacterium]
MLSESTMKGLVIHEYLTTDCRKIRDVVVGLRIRDILGRAREVRKQYSKTKEGESSLHANEEAFFKEPRTTAQPTSQVCSDVRPVETFWGRR